MEPTLGEVYRLVDSIKGDLAIHTRADETRDAEQDRKRHAAMDRLTPMFSQLEVRSIEHARLIAGLEVTVATLAKANVRNAVLLSGALVTLVIDLLVKLR